MKKIGQTDNGNIIVEMTPEEWDTFSQSNMMSFSQDDLIKWKELFREGIISRLKLPVRTGLKLLRAAGIWNDNLAHPHLHVNGIVFKRNGRLLPFATWCEMVLSDEVDCSVIKGFGPSMNSELHTAISRYLNGE